MKEKVVSCSIQNTEACEYCEDRNKCEVRKEREE